MVQSASVGGRDDFVQSVLHCHCFSSVIFRSWFLSWFLWIFSLVGLWAPQMDLLENEIISDVVVLSVVLEEVKNKNLSLYNRLRAIIDNPTRHFFVFANEHHK